MLSKKQLIAVVLALPVVGAAGYAWAFVQQERELEAMIAQRQWLEAETATSCANLPVIIGSAKDNGAAALYLSSFFASRGDDAETAAELDARGDKLLPAEQLDQAITNLIATAEMLEYRLKLPELAESCTRCAVQVAGRRQDDVDGAVGYFNMSRALLAMGQMCKKHDKLLIAEIAFRESTATASRAYKGTPPAESALRGRYGGQLKDALTAQIELLENQGKTQHLPFLKKRLAEVSNL